MQALACWRKKRDNHVSDFADMIVVDVYKTILHTMKFKTPEIFTIAHRIGWLQWLEALLGVLHSVPNSVLVVYYHEPPISFAARRVTS